MDVKNVTVVGLQWGDEGKGKVVDALGRTCRYVARYCGGANAGHSVDVQGEKFALHLIPCGILHENVVNVVGNGVAFDPAVAWEEIEGLRQRGVKVDSTNLKLSACAHVVMPYHKLQDSLNEQMLGGAKIGTTNRGIGPCYADKACRSTAVRLGDLLRPDEFRTRLRGIVETKNRMLSAMHDATPFDADKMADEYIEFGKRMSSMICDTGSLLRKACANGERILFEGGQGAMLDVDHGTYPFVTSSSVTACGIPSGAGVPPKAVGHVIGVAKSYASRVGQGPFPTEQDNEFGDAIRRRGKEFGTTTGRPRRCGWFDAVALRYAADLCGADEIALTVLMDGEEQIDAFRICTAYEFGGRRIDEYDPSLPLDKVSCVYEDWPAWKDPIGTARKFDDLPPEAQAYITRIEQLLGRPIGVISVGPPREATIMHHCALKDLK